jgi:hypothetical protein
MPQLHKRFHVSSGFTWLLQLLGLTLTNIKTELKAWKPTKNRAINLVIGVSALLIYEFMDDLFTGHTSIRTELIIFISQIFYSERLREHTINNQERTTGHLQKHG